MQRTNRPRRAASWSRPLAELVGAAIDPVLARQGFSQSDIILCWTEIVGERLAAATEPIKLRWPPRRADRTPEPATLVIRVESGFALEMQHCVDLVIERVNTHLGWRCVGRIALKQGPMMRRQAVARRRQQPSPAAQKAAEAHLGGIAAPDLRQALARLGAHVLEQTSREQTSREQTSASRRL